MPLRLATSCALLVNLQRSAPLGGGKAVNGLAEISLSGLTQRFLESVQPIVKNAVARSISGMVATSLNVPTVVAEPAPQAEPVVGHDAPQIDPIDAKIVTTSIERRLLAICLDVLADNEAYYTVLYQRKSNRWPFRYWGAKKRPAL